MQRELTLPFSDSSEGQGSLTPSVIQHGFTLVYSVPGPGCRGQRGLKSPKQGNTTEKAFVLRGYSEESDLALKEFTA